MSSISSYQKVLDTYKTLNSTSQTDAQYIPTQRALFADLSTLYSDWNNGKRVDQLHKGTYFEQAIRILNQQILQNRPSLLKRVLPLADSYCQSFKGVIQSVQNPQSLRTKLSELAKTHRQFMLEYAKVHQEAFPDQSLTIFNKYPKTISLFLRTIAPHVKELKQQMEDIEPSFVLLIPKLVIETLLQEPEQPIPELFSAQEEKIEKMRQIYSILSTKEKESLHKKLKGEDLQISTTTKILFDDIIIFSIPSTGDSKSEMNRVFRLLYEELMKISQINETFPQIKIRDKQTAAEYLIFTFLLNPELKKENLLLALRREKYWNPILSMRKDFTPRQVKELLQKQHLEEKSSSDDWKEQVQQSAQNMANSLNAAPWLEFLITIFL